jgi:class 3 adenylate cyclase
MVVAHHTFLFADLVGYTAFTAAAGDDRAAEMALEFHSRVRALLDDHLATEIKTMGDAIMLRCDCPARAMRLAVAIVRGLDGRDRMLPVRAGVCTGTAVPRHGDWYGTAVNLAARLCGAAGEGEALACAGTRAAAPDLASLELVERGPLRLKNLVEPVLAYAWTPGFVSAPSRRRPAPAPLPVPA